jgi:hypothetical protein
MTQRRAVKPNWRGRLYLRCVDDWKAAFEVAKLLGDTPVKSANVIRKQLFVMVASGLVEHHEGNDTFRITEAGRAALRAQREIK